MEEPTTVPTEEGLFDDYTEEDTPVEEEVTEEETKEETETESPVEETPDAPFLEIKYNHETRGLTQEEARTLAQKGLNYDKFYGSIDQLARMNGMSVSDYINSLHDTQMKFEVNKEVRELQKRYPDGDRDLLNEIAQKRVSERLARQNEISNQQDENLRAEMERQLTVFEKHFPNVDSAKLDRKVYDYMSDGYTLLEAYTLWKSEEDAKQRSVDDSKARIAKQNEDNRKRSLGNTGNVSSVEADDFLSGFLNG